ncbi:Phosphoenolpyruvate carboxykinase [GTP] [Actinomyces bovis]|uniref:Phosphoenolpyruvate carboxykinase [GTP] n=1 Tax=Actinomyces bovis TaxID=1658 RepID=A0ABY1VP54_9ACTO|nr:phosphoenolpyruvate carboxykinase (GTP) [Actinomyces bovis]SPT53898.1 Phosphoenolpyruvate carboxykinase [GTP] [Actinomyces bovis]VEG53342.1 Phosphoenolpyruvate carboxykinase [GTP] [Actinomyces israelii]
MTNPSETLIQAGITNTAVHDFVAEWAAILDPKHIEVIDHDAEQRLLAEALAEGEIIEAGTGRYLAHSHPKDTARSEERTVVATNNPADKGVYNNWRDAKEVRVQQVERMLGAMRGRTMYVVPYLMAPPGSPLAAWATGVELSDNRVVVLQMLRMARVGAQYVNDLEDPSFFERAVHATGDLDELGQGTTADKRLFATIADERTILHFGSAYGGNALLGKIAHGLRQGSYDGWTSKKFMGEQFMLIGIRDKETGRTYHICGGMPSASGKTNLAMMLPPAALGERYEVEFYGDDIVWLRVAEDGRVYGMNPEYGTFGVAKDTNWESNPNAMKAVAEGTGTLFVNVAFNEDTKELWWEGKTPDYPEDVTGWRDWKNELISARPLERQRSGADEDLWSQKNSRFTARLSVVPNIAQDYERAEGVPIDAIIFGGRCRDREPLIRAVTDLAEGVYDGLTLGAEATFAAEGTEGRLRYDPMSMRPFMSFPEGAYARHWLDILGAAEHKPIFAHVNWFQRDPQDGHFLWPGYGENLRALLWLMDLKEGRVQGARTPVGIVPTVEELNLEGFEGNRTDLEQLLNIDIARWKQEMVLREEHLAQFTDLPEEIWEAHRRVTQALEEAESSETAE